jgi:hypothetical protein
MALLGSLLGMEFFWSSSILNMVSLEQKTETRHPLLIVFFFFVGAWEVVLKGAALADLSKVCVVVCVVVATVSFVSTNNCATGAANVCTTGGLFFWDVLFFGAAGVFLFWG